MTAKQEAVKDFHASGMGGKLLTVREAARLKGVSPTTIYTAIAEQRLPAITLLNRLALNEHDVMIYEPTRYKDRAGAKGRGGRPTGIAMSGEGKQRISEAQKRRWAERKTAASTS